VADDFPNMRQFISGQPIMLQGLSIDLGGSVTVEGQPAEGDQFSIGSSSSQSVFATVAKLIGVLEGANVGAAGGAAKLSSDIGFALTNLDQASENILRVRAAIGSRMGEIDSISSVNGELDLQYQQTLSQLQDLDYAKAITDLSRKQTDLQAAQQSFVRVSQLSLFNYL
jgi:flagellar hook-associated protein 3 FlgL